MFWFIKNSIELNNVAKVMMLVYESVQELESSKKVTYNESDILVLAYICQRWIRGRISKYGWSDDWKLVVPNINRWSISMAYWLSQTVHKVITLASKISPDFAESIVEIYKYDSMPAEFEENIKKMLPENVKKLLI